jgi:DNA-binding GntR family transcriptional regulator
MLTDSSQPERLSRRLARGTLRTLSREVYERLRHDIITCRLAPGQMIYESDLTAQYGVSRTPVREALRQLIQDELVVSIPSIGHVVAPIVAQDLKDLVAVRQALEAAAIQECSKRITENELKELEALAEGDAQRLTAIFRDEHSAQAWYEANTRFHVRLAELSGNRLLTQMTRRLMEGAERFYYANVGARPNPPAPAPQHRGIVMALRSGDVETAIRLAREDAAVTTAYLEQLDGPVTIAPPPPAHLADQSPAALPSDPI